MPLDAQIASGFPFAYNRETDSKVHLCRDTGRVSEGHLAVQGAVRILCM